MVPGHARHVPAVGLHVPIPQCMHFDDGWRTLVGLPDASVHLLEAHVTHCTCAHCLLTSNDGELLGPGGRVFDCPNPQRIDPPQ